MPMRDPLEPDMVLGKSVIGADGVELGRVVDVGLGDWARVKFLVVDRGSPTGLLDIDATAVASVGTDEILLSEGLGSA